MQERIVERFRIMVVEQNKIVAASQIVKGFEYQRVSLPRDDGGDIQLFHRAPPCRIMFRIGEIVILMKIICQAARVCYDLHHNLDSLNINHYCIHGERAEGHKKIRIYL